MARSMRSPTRAKTLLETRSLNLDASRSEEDGPKAHEDASRAARSADWDSQYLKLGGDDTPAARLPAYPAHSDHGHRTGDPLPQSQGGSPGRAQLPNSARLSPGQDQRAETQRKSARKRPRSSDKRDHPIGQPREALHETAGKRRRTEPRPASPTPQPPNRADQTPQQK